VCEVEARAEVIEQVLAALRRVLLRAVYDSSELLLSEKGGEGFAERARR
jgi:hypothetical protein